MGFPGDPVVKNLSASAAAAGDSGAIPGSGRSPEEQMATPPQYSCQDNPTDRGGWRATVRGVIKESDATKQLSLHACIYFRFFSLTVYYKILSTVPYATQ